MSSNALVKCRPWKFSMLDHDAFVAQILSLRSNLIFARPFFKTPRPFFKTPRPNL
ncbi:hypothetical protein F2Q69_00012587 [Brassica cretica]|uniref:Uncharacterized protein n=1 Tax=Brassica cretica TaxID=69181 RepID=A0A8S9QLN9_BRACR|nr:hypothetical protein F2Q69_00012587 [Brassica cretica]